MAGQAKNVIQAEIDAACELIDFFTFNVQSALELEQSQPLRKHLYQYYIYTSTTSVGWR